MSFNSPVEYDSYYATGRRRWMQVDRRGNLLELSEVEDENWARMRSGEAEHTVSSFDDGSWVRAWGFHRIEARSIFTRSHNLFAQVESELVLQVAGNGRGMYVNSQPLLGLYSTYLMDIYAKDEIAIGQYLSREITMIPPAEKQERTTWMQTRFMWVAPKILLLGLCSRDMFAYYTNCPPDASNLDKPEGGVGPDAKGWAWMPTERVRMEATQDIVIRTGRDNRPGTAIDDTFMGMYSTGKQEIWAKKRTWIGQYVNTRHNTAYQGATVVVSPSRLVLGYSKNDLDCEPGVSNFQLNEMQYALALPAQAKNTEYVSVWSDWLIQLRITEAVAAEPDAAPTAGPVVPFGYGAIKSGVGKNPHIVRTVCVAENNERELAKEDILIQGVSVVIQSEPFDTPTSKGAVYSDAGGIRFCPGVLRVVGTMSTVYMGTETLYDLDSRFNELYFDDEDSTALVGYSDPGGVSLVDGNLRFRVEDKGGRALVKIVGPPCAVYGDENHETPPQGSVLQGNAGLWVDVYTLQNKISVYHVGPAAADAYRDTSGVASLSLDPNTRVLTLTPTIIQFDKRGHRAGTRAAAGGEILTVTLPAGIVPSGTQQHEMLSWDTTAGAWVVHGNTNHPVNLAHNGTTKLEYIGPNDPGGKIEGWWMYQCLVMPDFTASPSGFIRFGTGGLGSTGRVTCEVLRVGAWDAYLSPSFRLEVPILAQGFYVKILEWNGTRVELSQPWEFTNYVKIPDGSATSYYLRFGDGGLNSVGRIQARTLRLGNNSYLDGNQFRIAVPYGSGDWTTILDWNGTQVETWYTWKFNGSIAMPDGTGNGIITFGTGGSGSIGRLTSETLRVGYRDMGGHAFKLAMMDGNGDWFNILNCTGTQVETQKPWKFNSTIEMPDATANGIIRFGTTGSGSVGQLSGETLRVGYQDMGGASFRLAMRDLNGNWFNLLNWDGTKVSAAKDWKFTGNIGFFNKDPQAQPSGASQAEVTPGNVDGEIGGIAINTADAGADTVDRATTAKKADVESLRNACEELADDMRAAVGLVNAMRSALVTLGLIKGSA
jgi:hypothetical protein